MISELNNRLCNISWFTTELFMPEPDMVLQYMDMPADGGQRAPAIVEGIHDSIEYLRGQDMLPHVACTAVSIDCKCDDAIVFPGGHEYCDSQDFFQDAYGAVLIIVTLGDIAERLWGSQEFDPFASLANDAVIGAATEVVLGRVIREILQICVEMAIPVGYFLSPGCCEISLDLQPMIVQYASTNRVALQGNVIKPAASLSGILPVGGLEMQNGNGKICCNICSRAQVCIDKRIEFW
jgi:hypothetical protein